MREINRGLPIYDVLLERVRTIEGTTNCTLAELANRVTNDPNINWPAILENERSQHPAWDTVRVVFRCPAEKPPGVVADHWQLMVIRSFVTPCLFPSEM